MLIRVDTSSDRPLFTQVADAVRAAVLLGDVATGDRLPSARDLAASLEVNLHTVLRAYQVLRDEGVIDMRRGRGAVVVADSEHWATLHTAMRAVAAEARRLGLGPDAVASLTSSVLRKETS